MIKKILKGIGITIVILIVAAGVLFYLAMRQYDKQDSGVLVNNVIADTIPFTYSPSGHMLISVRIEGSKKSYPFILDSGASSFIFLHHSNEFDLEENGVALGMGGNGGFMINHFKNIDSIQIGRFKFHDINAKETDFTFSCFDDIYGIIGKEVMRHLTWQIDFENQTIIVVSDPDLLSYDTNKIVIPLNENRYSHHLRARIQLNGHSKSKYVLVDLGNNGVLNIGESYLSSEPVNLKKKSISGNVSYSLSGTVDGEGKEKIYLFDSLIFKSANTGFSNIPVMTSPDGIDLLGLGFLKKFRTTLNWNNQTLTLEPYDENPNFMWKTAGTFLKYDQETNKVIIKAVMDETNASKAGILTNSSVISVNDFTFTDEQSYCDYLKTEMKLQRDTVHLKLEQEGSIKSYELLSEPVF